MSRFMAALLLGGSLLLSGLAVAQANPLYADGQQVTVKGAEDFGATILKYLLMPILPLFGTLMALSGGANLGQRDGAGKGATKIVTGLGVGFVPAMIKPGSDYATAASFGAAWLPGATWLDVVGGLVFHALVLTLLYAWYRRSHCVEKVCHGL